jgi:hypothetical protein
MKLVSHFSIIELCSVCNFLDFGWIFFEDFVVGFGVILVAKSKQTRALKVMQRNAFVWFAFETFEKNYVRRKNHIQLAEKRKCQNFWWGQTANEPLFLEDCLAEFWTLPLNLSRVLEQFPRDFFDSKCRCRNRLARWGMLSAKMKSRTRKSIF